MKRVTISDVAAYAGVSKSTVSHALSGKRPISAATRRRVKQAVEALGYRPHPVAQRLAGGQTRTIGYVYPLYSPHIAGLEMKFIASMANEINQADYAFMLLTHPAHDVDSLQRFAASGLVDGFVLMQIRLYDARVQMLQQSGVPFVLVGRCADNQGLSFVDVDLNLAMGQCLGHLAKRGHRAVAYIHQDDLEFGFVHRAVEAFAAACRQREMVAHTYACPLNMEAGAAVMKRLLSEHPEVTAVIIWNNAVAWGSIDVALAAGRHIPTDLSIISFGHSDITPPAAMPLTVLDIMPERLAAQAAVLLLDRLADPGQPAAHVLLTPRLIVRESTAVAT